MYKVFVVLLSKAVCMTIQPLIAQDDFEDSDIGGGVAMAYNTFPLLCVTQFVAHCRFYQTLVLWLDEPRLHDPSLFLPSLPPPYDPARLETLLKPQLVCNYCQLS